MGSARGRAQDPTHDEGDGRWGAIPEAMVESLRFVRFRREHKPRTRYPQILRAAVLAALQRGVAEPALRRACGLSAVQLAAWRRRELARIGRIIASPCVSGRPGPVVVTVRA